jgi:predicted nucleotidyltransferase
VRLLAYVTSQLGREQIEFAMIGAAALAAHGVSRSTVDIDLLVVDPRVLSLTSTEPSVAVDVRRGAADDPLAGVVRFSQPQERDVDVVVGRSRWQQGIIRRAQAINVGELTVPVVDVTDLILLKLYAGGSQDAWDIEQLLAVADHAAVTAAVDALVHELPHDAQTLWQRLRTVT